VACGTFSHDSLQWLTVPPLQSWRTWGRARRNDMWAVVGHGKGILGNDFRNSGTCGLPPQAGGMGNKPGRRPLLGNRARSLPRTSAGRLDALTGRDCCAPPGPRGSRLLPSHTTLTPTAPLRTARLTTHHASDTSTPGHQRDACDIRSHCLLSDGLGTRVRSYA